MTTVTIATRSKPSPNSKVGVSFAKSSLGRLVVTNISPTSIFVGSGLRVGQELLSINGVSVRTSSPQEVGAIFASLENEVTIEAGPGKPVEQSHTLSCSLLRKQGGSVTIQFDSRQAQRVPAFLLSMGVSQHKWSRVINAFAELISAVQQTLTMDHVLRSEMAQYTGKQMTKGYIGFGQESHHERKVFMMTHQAAIQHSNQTLVANNVITKINALLNKHDVMAELGFTARTLPNFSTKACVNNTISIPTAIKFTQIDDWSDSGAVDGVARIENSQVVVANATAIPINETEESDC